MALGRGATLDLSAKISADTSEFERRIRAAAGNSDDFAKSLNRLAQQSEAARQSQREMAQQAGISARELSRLERQAAQLEKEMQGQADAANAARTELGQFGAVISGAVLAGIGATVTAAAQFEKELSNVRAASNATTDEMSKLGAAALEAGQATVFSATDAAKAQAELARAGVSTADILGGALRGSLDLAAAGQIDLADAAGISAKALNIFNLQGGDIGHVADLLSAGANKSATSVGELGAALNQSGQVAAQTGLSIEDTVAALTMFADAGLTGSDAGTSFKTMLQALTPNSKQAKEEMERLGISFFDAKGEFIGFEGVAGEIQDGLKNLSVEQRSLAMETIFGSDAVRAASVFYEQGARGAEEYGRKVDDAGHAARTAATQTDNLVGDLERLTGAISTAAIESGTSLAGVSRGAVQGAEAIVNAYNDLPGPLQTGVTLLGGFAGAAGLAASGLLLAIPRIQETRTAMDALNASGSKIPGVLGGIGRAGAIGATVGVLAVSLGALQDEIDRLLNRQNADVSGLTKDLLDYANSGVLAGEAARVLGEDFSLFNDALQEVSDPSAWDRLIHAGERTAAVIQPYSNQWERLQDAVRGYDSALAEMVTTGNADTAADLFGQIAAEAERQGVPVEALEKAMPAYARALDQTAVAAEGAAKGSDALATATEGMTPEMEAAKQSAEEYAEYIKELADTLNAFSDPAAIYQGYLQDIATATADSTGDAKDSWQDYVDTVDISLDDFAKRLEEDNEAQRDWQVNLGTIASRGAGDVVSTLAGMGAEGARLTAELATASDEEFQRLATALRENTRLGSEGAATELDKGMRTMEELARVGAVGTVENLRRELSKGTITLAEIARRYGFILAEGVNPIIIATGGRKIVVGDTNSNRQRPGPQLAAGGPVWGEGTATSDSIPAYLSNGEYVVKAASVAKYGQGFLDAINAGQFALGGFVRRARKFAAGGFITPDDVPPPTKVDPYRPPLSTAATGAMDAARAAVMAYIGQNAIPTGGSGVGLAGQPMGVQQMMRIINGEFGPTRLISGFRPGAITATGNRSYHGMGRAVDLPPNMALFNFLRGRFPNARELIFSPAGNRQIHNGRPHVYTGITRANHFDHVHLAMRNGGLVGRGQKPQRLAAGGPVTRVLAQESYINSSLAQLRSFDLASRMVGDRDVGTDPPSRQSVERAELLLDLYRMRNDEIDRMVERETLLAEMARTGAEWRRVDAAFHASRNEEQRADLMREFDQLSQEGARQRERLAQMDQERARRLEVLQLELDIAEARERQEKAAERNAIADARRQNAEGALQDVTRMLAEQEQIRERMEESQRRLVEGVAEARRALNDRIRDLTSARAEELRGWAALTEPVSVQWGNTVGSLTRNVQQQVAQFNEWAASLAVARERGVSERVIRALGLDAGPQALGQLREFGRATQAEIDALNRAVASRSGAAEQQADAEALNGMTRLGQSLVAAREQANEQIAKLNADFATSQRDAADELAAIGRDTGLGYAQAVRQAMDSELEAIRQAGLRLREAARGLGPGSGGIPAELRDGRYVDTRTGRLAFYGPNGEPGTASPTGEFTERHVMPDGRVAYYKPNNFRYNSGSLVRGSFQGGRLTAPSGGWSRVEVPSVRQTVVVQLDGRTIASSTTTYQAAAERKLTIKAGA